jgi:hypothetical protein
LLEATYAKDKAGMQKTQPQEYQSCDSENWQTQKPQKDYLTRRYQTQPPYQHPYHAASTQTDDRPELQEYAPSGAEKKASSFFTAYQFAARQIARKSSATSAAPPINPPSISLCANNSSRILRLHTTTIQNTQDHLPHQPSSIATCARIAA